MLSQSTEPTPWNTCDQTVYTGKKRLSQMCGCFHIHVYEHCTMCINTTLIKGRVGVVGRKGRVGVVGRKGRVGDSGEERERVGG